MIAAPAIERASEAPRDAARRVVIGAGAQVVAKLIALLLNIVASLALIRYFGPARYGDYVFIFAFAGILGVISDLGISRVAAREMAKGDTSAVLGTSVLCRLALATIAAAAAQLALLPTHTRPEIRIGVAIASLPFFTDALLSVVIVFQVRLAAQYEALVSTVAQAVDTALILALIYSGAGLLPLATAPAASGVIGAALAILIARRRFAAKATIDMRRVRYLLAESWPAGLALMITLLYVKFDSVLVALMRPPTEVGLYGAAYKPIEYVAVVFAVLMTTLFPLLAKWYAKDHDRFQFAYRRGVEALLALALPVPVLLAFTAKPLVTALYTRAFVSSAPALTVLGIAMVLYVFNVWQAFTMLAAGRQRVTLAYDVVTLVANLGLNLWLIPKYGFMGAAVAALATGAIVTVFSVTAIGTLLHAIPAPDRIARLLFASACLAVTIWALNTVGLPWWAAAIGGALTYPAILLVTRAVNLGELMKLVPAR
jgi:O-antigen/teichoic acid export membrane protein